MANPHGLKAAATPAPNANPRGAIIPRSLKNPPRLPDRPSTNRLTPSIPVSLLSRSAPTKATARAAAATRTGKSTLLTNVVPSEIAVVPLMASPSCRSSTISHFWIRCSRVRSRFRAQNRGQGLCKVARLCEKATLRLRSAALSMQGARPSGAGAYSAPLSLGSRRSLTASPNMFRL